MRNKIFNSTVVFILVMFCAAFDARAQSPVTPILEKMDRHSKSLVTLEADVAMSKFNAQLGVADPTYNGKVWYVPGKNPQQMRIRLDWISPVQEQMLIASGQYRIFRPKLRQAFEGSVDKARNNAQAANPLAFLSMNRDQLRANYTVSYIGVESVGRGQILTSRIQLIPKDRTRYRQADLWVDADGMPIKATVVATNGDSTTIVISNAAKNKTLDAKLFSIKLPDGTKIIKD
jgi:outer membrane lipoprotein-sorting protein